MILPRALLAALAASAALLASGCFAFTTRHEGDQLRRDVTALAGRVEALTASVPRLQATAARSEEQVQRLQGVLDKTERLLRSASANLVADVEKIRADLNTLLGQAEELRVGLAALDKSFAEYRAATDVKLEQLQQQSPKATAPPIPEDREQLWAEAERRFAANQLEDARRLYRAFADRNPADPRTDNARLQIGESYLREKKYAAAIGELTKLIDGARRGDDAIDDAMFKSGQAFAELQYFCDARVYFQQLALRFPDSPHVKEARALEKEMLRRARAARQKCGG